MPPLCVGTAPFGPFFGPMSEQEVAAVVETALAEGANCFDTAPLYDAGLVEERLGRALAGVPRSSYTLATKVGHLVDANRTVTINYSRDGVLRSLEASLGRLGVRHVDVVHIHEPTGHDPRDFLGPMLDNALPALLDLKSAGVIRAIGCGMNRWEVIPALIARGDVDCVMLAGRYSLLEQDALAALNLCMERGVSVLLAGVFNSGVLATGSRGVARYNYAPAPPEVIARVERLEALCAQYEVALPTAALHFPLAHPAVIGLVVGVRSSAELQRNLHALHADIPPALWRHLSAEGLIQTDR